MGATQDSLCKGKTTRECLSFCQAESSSGLMRHVTCRLHGCARCGAHYPGSLALLSAAARPRGLEMVSHRARWAARSASLLVVSLTLAGVPASRASAQYFGRNKVQYEKFDWKILRSDHFDNFFYPPESLIVQDFARMAERWYTRHSDTFRHAFDCKSLIFYADHAD